MKEDRKKRAAVENRKRIGKERKGGTCGLFLEPLYILFVIMREIVM